MTLSVLVLSDSSSLRTLPRSYCKKTCPRRESPLGRYTRLQALDHVQAAQNEGLYIKSGLSRVPACIVDDMFV
jgi:hypothetical protein